MIAFNKDVLDKIFEIISVEIEKGPHIGPPSIFYWFRNIMESIKNIGTYDRLKPGQYNYQLDYSLGIVKLTCDFVGKDILIVINQIEINPSAIANWMESNAKGGFVKHPKSYSLLTRKPLFGYRYVMNQSKQYNLLTQEGKLLTKWFNAIKPLQQPYGKYQIIAYLNIGGFLYALGMNGQTYNLNRAWKDAYTNENYNIQSLLLITESYIDKQRTIRLTEQELSHIIKTSILEVLQNRGKMLRG